MHAFPANVKVTSQVLFSKRINRKYEEINEKSVETEFEFLTEQEMEEKGWSECLRWQRIPKPLNPERLNPKPLNPKPLNPEVKTLSLL